MMTISNQFRTISDVTPPRFHLEQRLEALSSDGRWVEAIVREVVFMKTKVGRRFVWHWAYLVLLVEIKVGVVRYENCLRAYVRDLKKSA